MSGAFGDPKANEALDRMAADLGIAPMPAYDEFTSVRDDLLTRLRAWAVESEADDAERPHINADKALLEYIDDPEITEAFTSITRWYS